MAGLTGYFLSAQRPCVSCGAKPSKVIAFGSSKDMSNPYRVFSNHHLHDPPFKYVVQVGAFKGTIILCEHANKALHATKASVFGDRENFDEICAEQEPGKC